MSADDGDGLHHEIVIIRRPRGSDDEGSHGAAWKIAYADFMTAMMAFFLVMWLVNAADKKTVTEIAAYFNPVKLSDKVTAPKGIYKLQASETMREPDPGARLEKSDSKLDAACQAQPKSDVDRNAINADKTDSKNKYYSMHEKDMQNDEMFRDPFGVMSRLGSTPEAATAGHAEHSEQSRADFWSDPFGPKVGNSPKLKPEINGSSGDLKVSSESAEIEERSAEAPLSRLQVMGSPRNKSEGSSVANQTPGQIGKKAADLARQFEQSIRFASVDRMPAIEIEATPEGVLISITDKQNFGMFDIGSAVPTPDLVRLMGQLGGLLAITPGRIVVRGYTDARPYRSESYDNWRLSTSRAHAAYYMLAKGGLDESRIVGVEGHADRMPKFPADPFSPSNRRIEILVQSKDGR